MSRYIYFTNINILCFKTEKVYNNIVLVDPKIAITMQLRFENENSWKQHLREVDSIDRMVCLYATGQFTDHA
jgi:hypothetical protein